MDTPTALSVIALAALIHASFQLGVSAVTLLSSHSAGKKVAAKKTSRLVGAFLLGTLTITTLLLAALLYAVLLHLEVLWQTPRTLWTIVCGILAGLGVAVWGFYYRRGAGTPLWIPRAFARFLTNRIRSTSLGVEAFSLGLTTVIAELPFIAAPLFTAVLALVYLPPHLQIISILGYILVASSGSIIIAILTGSGHSISRIQHWREANKRFLQFVAGTGLIVLACYLYVNQVITTVVAGAAVQ